MFHISVHICLWEAIMLGPCCLAKMLIFKVYFWDFPGGPVVKNPPCNVRVVGLISGQGTKIPYAGQQLNLRAATKTWCSQISKWFLKIMSLSYRAYVWVLLFHPIRQANIVIGMFIIVMFNVIFKTIWFKFDVLLFSIWISFWISLFLPSFELLDHF